MMARCAKRIHVEIDTLDSKRCRDKNDGSRKVSAMPSKIWETPSFVEINMSAEIGGYQSDFGDRDPMEPVAAPQLDRVATDAE
jgi:hypothetical protein